MSSCHQGRYGGYRDREGGEETLFLSAFPHTSFQRHDNAGDFSLTGVDEASDGKVWLGVFRGSESPPSIPWAEVGKQFTHASIYPQKDLPRRGFSQLRVHRTQWLREGL